MIGKAKELNRTDRKMTKLQKLAKTLARDEANQEYNFNAWEKFDKKRIYVTKKSNNKTMCFYDFDENFELNNPSKVDDNDMKIINEFLENFQENTTVNPYENDDKLNERFAVEQLI